MLSNDDLAALGEGRHIADTSRHGRPVIVVRAEWREGGERHLIDPRSVRFHVVSNAHV
jgi:hypothetical protein